MGFGVGHWEVAGGAGFLGGKVGSVESCDSGSERVWLLGGDVLNEEGWSIGGALCKIVVF